MKNSLNFIMKSSLNNGIKSCKKIKKVKKSKILLGKVKIMIKRKIILENSKILKKFNINIQYENKSK